MSVTQTCAKAMQKACVAYTTEIIEELSRRGLMTAESLASATELLGGMQLTARQDEKGESGEGEKASRRDPFSSYPILWHP